MGSQRHSAWLAVTGMGQSLSIGLSIMALVSLGCWWLEKGENIRIPFVPFLLLGYWMRGTVYGI